MARSNKPMQVGRAGTKGGDRTTKRPLTPIPSALEAPRRDWPVKHKVDLNRLARNRTDANAELAQVPV